MARAIRRIGILTSGGIAPCLSAVVGGLVARYSERAPQVDLLCYRYGYAGLLRGQSIEVTPDLRAQASVLRRYGGSPIGNSRVRLTNTADCVKRGLVQDGQDPRQVAADQLRRDGVDVLHTVGGDDTSTAAADLADYLERHGYALTVVGLPKTIDNDIVPVRQSLGAITAAEQGARFFEHVVTEHTASPRTLIVHEIMGRHCGWLTAATARAYLAWVDAGEFVPGLGLARECWDVHGLYLPEMPFDLEAEGERLRALMDRYSVVNLFVSEGAGVEAILAERDASGKPVERDPFGHVKLDTVNVGQWFGDQLAPRIGAEKLLVQKSGRFARSAPAGPADLALIDRCVDHAVDCALRGESGLVGEDEEQGDALRAIELARIRGGKIFDVQVPWFGGILDRIGQQRPPTGG